MDDVSDDERDCPICFEDKDDLRMLPCWHVACLGCILGMTRYGTGRAVSCHACRQPCLFENIRSLPRPITCPECKQFVKSPRKFSCCSRLYCFSCIEATQDSDELVRCPAKCIKKVYNVKTLPAARLCGLCFKMHTEMMDECGHSFCAACRRKLNAKRRQCPLCFAMKNPFPEPTNPMRGAPQEHINASFENVTDQGTTASRQPATASRQPANVSRQPATASRQPATASRPPASGQPVSQSQALSAMQILRQWQQGNPGRTIPQQQEPQGSYTMKEVMEDAPKGAIFLITFFMMGYYHGLGFGMWIVCAPILYLLKPNTIFTANLILGVWLLAWIISLYTEFVATILIDVIFCIFSRSIKYISKLFFKDELQLKFVEYGKLSVYFFFLWLYSPPIILHRNMLGTIAPKVADMVKIPGLTT